MHIIIILLVEHTCITFRIANEAIEQLIRKIRKTSLTDLTSKDIVLERSLRLVLIQGSMRIRPPSEFSMN